MHTCRWTQWLETYEQKLYVRALARRSQAALFSVKPTVRAGFAKWRVAVEGTRARSAGRAQRGTLKDVERLEAEVAALQMPPPDRTYRTSPDQFTRTPTVPTLTLTPGGRPQTAHEVATD